VTLSGVSLSDVVPQVTRTLVLASDTSLRGEVASYLASH
jgi:hypothetical protein